MFELKSIRGTSYEKKYKFNGDPVEHPFFDVYRFQKSGCIFQLSSRTMQNPRLRHGMVEAIIIHVLIDKNCYSECFFNTDGVGNPSMQLLDSKMLLAKETIEKYLNSFEKIQKQRLIEDLEKWQSKSYTYVNCGTVFFKQYAE